MGSHERERRGQATPPDDGRRSPANALEAGADEGREARSHGRRDAGKEPSPAGTQAEVRRAGMRIQNEEFTCGKCGEQFIGETVMDAPVDLWIASVRKIRCPVCGERNKLFFGWARKKKAKKK